MPETAWNYWNLIKFNEHEREDGSMQLLMRKDQCMHCEDPGCLAACPADAAIVQYANGIVDFQEAHCIGCGYCMTGCPFNIPKFSPEARKVFKCTLCNDRVSVGLEPACIKACPTGCLHFGTKLEMKELGETRAEQLRTQSGFADAGVYDPEGVGGTHVIYVLHDAKSGAVWRIAEESAHSVFGAFVEGTPEMAGKFGDGWRAGRAGVALLASWAEEGRADSAG